MRGIHSIFLTCFSLALCSQGVVRGRVVDKETGEGLIGAHLYLLKDWRNGTTTGMDGEFELTVDPSVGDSLIVSFIGFEEMLLPLQSKMLIALAPIALEGELVVVTAKPLIAEEFKYLKLNKLDIYTNPAAKADPILAVNALPASTTTDESANISLRGSSPIETSIFLNNVPVYDAVRFSQLNGIGTFSIFNTSIIKNLVVFPGNPPLEFGNTSAGIISLTTDDDVIDDNANSAVISLASIGVMREQKLNKNQSLKVFSNWQPSAAIKAVNETSLRDIKSFRSGDLGVYWYGSKEKLSWKVLNYSLVEGYLFNFIHPSFSGNFDQKKKRNFTVSTVELPIAKGILSFNNGMSFSSGNYQYSSAVFSSKQRDFFSGLNYLISNEAFSLKTGLSYDLRNSQVDGNFHEFSFALAENHPTMTFDGEAYSKTLESYAYFKYYLSNQLVIGSGLRKNVPIDDQKSYLSRQLNAAYTNFPWSMTIGAGKYHKNGLLENTGEAFISESNQLSLDLKYEKPGFQVAFSLFDKQNLINESEYDARGVELLVDYTFSSKLRSSTSITLLDASSTGEGTYQYDLKYFIRGNLAYSPGKFWTIESTLLTREGTPYTPIADATYNNSLQVYEPFSASVDSRLPAYLNLSISVSKMLPISEKMNVIVFTSLTNILDSKNIRSYVYNSDYTESSASYYSRRTGYFGAMISF